MAVETLYETMGLTRIVEIDPAGRAVLEYQARPEQCHSGGVVQGGFVTGWIDAAMAHAAMAIAGQDVVPMTLELKVSFLAPARPGPVFAEAWAIRHGRKTAFYEGALKDGAGTLIAKASSTMMMADRHKVEAAARAATAST
ncbi:MAG: PaaI family thioesterase [Novosphingobium sp.]